MCECVCVFFLCLVGESDDSGESDADTVVVVVVRVVMVYHLVAGVAIGGTRVMHGAHGVCLAAHNTYTHHTHHTQPYIHTSHTTHTARTYTHMPIVIIHHHSTSWYSNWKYIHLYESIHNLLHYSTSYSIIVSRHPPPSSCHLSSWNST